MEQLIDLAEPIMSYMDTANEKGIKADILKAFEKHNTSNVAAQGPDKIHTEPTEGTGTPAVSSLEWPPVTKPHDSRPDHGPWNGFVNLGLPHTVVLESPISVMSTPMERWLAELPSDARYMRNEVLEHSPDREPASEPRLRKNS